MVSDALGAGVDAFYAGSVSPPPASTEADTDLNDPDTDPFERARKQAKDREKETLKGVAMRGAA